MKIIVFTFIGILVAIGIYGASIHYLNRPLWRQNTELLADQNGLILSIKRIRNLPAALKDSLPVEGYRLEYMSDGLRVVGFLFRPKAAETYPILIFNRGGNRDYAKITPVRYADLMLLAHAGYVVLASQYRGADGGEGQDEFGGRDINDVLNMIKLGQSLPFAQPDNIVMLGYSRGGRMTYLAIKEEAPIKAAAVVGGGADLFMSYANRDRYYRELLVELIGGPPAEMEAEYIARSATYWPERINTPILILHGEDDGNVGVEQAIKMAKKLAEHGKEFKLVTFPGGNHPLTTHRKARDELIYQWFKAHLAE